MDPYSLGMHRENYSKARFYDDLQTHIRFKTPSISLTGIVGGQGSPLAKLETSAVPLQEGGHGADVGSFEYQLKLFCCILQSSLRDFVAVIGETTDEDDNEQLIFRRNVLKKYMHNVLFLDTRTRREGKVIEHGLFGIAAGISMLFATVVLFLSQSLYGPLTLPVFLALVIGYMFKDRIKEMLRVYFSRKVSSLLFDDKTRIYSDPHHPIGHCRESFDCATEAMTGSATNACASL